MTDGRDGGETEMSGWAVLEQFLQTDPADVGCEQAIRVLHVYVDLVLDPHLGSTHADRVRAASALHPGVAAHLAACGPCGQDFDGLLAAVQIESPPQYQAQSRAGFPPDSQPRPGGQ